MLLERQPQVRKNPGLCSRGWGLGGGGAPVCRHRLTAARLKISWPAYRADTRAPAAQSRRAARPSASHAAARHSLCDNLAVPTPAHNNNTRDLHTTVFTRDSIPLVPGVQWSCLVTRSRALRPDMWKTKPLWQRRPAVCGVPELRTKWNNKVSWTSVILT